MEIPSHRQLCLFPWTVNFAISFYSWLQSNTKVSLIFSLPLPVCVCGEGLKGAYVHIYIFLHVCMWGLDVISGVIPKAPSTVCFRQYPVSKVIWPPRSRCLPISACLCLCQSLPVFASSLRGVGFTTTPDFCLVVSGTQNQPLIFEWQIFDLLSCVPNCTYSLLEKFLTLQIDR